MKSEEQKKIEKKERDKKYYEAHKVEIMAKNIKYQQEHPEQKSKAPENVHQKYPHALKRPESIIEINRIAFDFLTNNIKQI